MNSDQELDQLLKQSAAAHQPALPSPDLIWWRAHMLRKQEEKKRIEKPMLIAHRLAIAVCTVIMVLTIAMNWSQFQDLLSRDMGLLYLAVAAAAILLISAAFLRLPARR